MGATAKQLAKEYWLPLLLAAAWTGYDWYINVGHRILSVGVPIFGSSFFLLSWLTGQFVRVRRQAKVEGSLTGVAGRIDILIDRLDAASQRLVDTVTGGESIAYLTFPRNAGSRLSPVIVHHGQHSLTNMTIRAVNLENFSADVEAGDPTRSDTVIQMAEVNPGTATLNAGLFNTVIEGAKQDFNVFFSARNGRWVQLLRMRRVGEEWITAFIVLRDQVTVLGHLPPEFPLIGEAEFDGFERSAGPREPENPIAGES